MHIDLLADHVDFIPALAAWFRAEWPDARHDPAAELARACNRRRIPLALVAVENTQVVGTVSLLERSVASHAHLSPWVAALYVRPDVRHRGLATRLIDAATHRAQELGCADVFIGVSGAREHYEAFGWVYLGDGEADGEAVTVLRRTLGNTVV